MEPIHQPVIDLEIRRTAGVMERVMAEVRQHWFDARLTESSSGLSVAEQGGEILMCIDCDEGEADRLIACSMAKGAYMVSTGVSRPADLGPRLKRAGYRLVQQHWTYLLNPQAAPLRHEHARHRLMGLLPWSDPPAVDVQRIDLAELSQWNEVSWQAFGARGTLQDALSDKCRAYLNMGEQGSWYLARLRGRPVGTACVYRGSGAAQVLAVGTLPGYRDRGVATAVMERVISDWRAGSEPVLFLDARAGSAAERIYSRLGFHPLYLRELYGPAPR